MPKPPKVIINKMFHSVGFPAYHLCAAAKPKNTNNATATHLLYELAAGEYKAGVVALLSTATVVVVAAFVRATGNEAKARSAVISEINRKRIDNFVFIA